MNDFDFEELDKAVSNLASKTHEEHGDPELQDTPVVPVSVSRPALDDKPASEPVAISLNELKPPEPQPSEPASTPEPVVVPQQHTRLSVARPHSRGSFMDIVPPTSRKSAAHVGISLQPVSKPEDVVPEETQSQKKESKIAPQAPEPELTSKLEDVANELAAQELTPDHNKTGEEIAWPDPIDLQDGEPKEEAKSTDVVETASPFLTEAKVEKRPLGAFSAFRPAMEDKPAEEPTDTKTEPASAVDELTPDESGLFVEPKEAPRAPDKPTEPKESEPDKEPTKPDVHGAAMMSIPQQYRTEAKAANTSTRPVFDTKEYHPPLLEAAVHDHRGGMWGKIFIALVTLALLAVAGYFAYIYFAQH